MFLKVSKNLKHDIKIFYNIFYNYERKKILEQFKSQLCKIEGCPGLQTYSNLHNICEKNSSYFNPFIKIQQRIKINNPIFKSWINYTDHELKYTSWHDHATSPFNKTCVYMLENPEKIGTWFLVNGQIYKVKCPTNSLILFPNYLLHTVPGDIKKPRYTLAIDFM